jgi:4-diphosphocytidyl-2C-methyl-D-erythritol kinase
VSRYKNGFHGIRSLFVETDLFDVIEYEKNDSNEIEVIDKSNILSEDNLLKRAGDEFIKEIGKYLLVLIFILKNKFQ